MTTTMDAFPSQVSLESSPEKAGSLQTPPPSDAMNDPHTAQYRLVDLPTEPTVLYSTATATATAVVERDDFKRQCKMANGFMLVLLTISAALIVTIPGPMYSDGEVLLHATDAAFAFASLIGSFFLFFYSLRSHPGAELAKVQGTVMGFSTALLVLAALSRLVLLFPWQLAALSDGGDRRHAHRPTLSPT